MKSKKAIKKEIIRSGIWAQKEDGFLMFKLREQEFPKWNIEDLRDWLQTNGLSRKLTIEWYATEIAIVTPNGIILTDSEAYKGHIGLIGDIDKGGESPIDTAVRILEKEAGIQVLPEQLEDAKSCSWCEYTYKNGDKVRFWIKRFILHLDYIPELISTNYDIGVHFAAPIVEHQRGFIKDVLEKYFCKPDGN